MFLSGHEVIIQQHPTSSPLGDSLYRWSPLVWMVDSLVKHEDRMADVGMKSGESPSLRYWSVDVVLYSCICSPLESALFVIN